MKHLVWICADIPLMQERIKQKFRELEIRKAIITEEKREDGVLTLKFDAPADEPKDIIRLIKQGKYPPAETKK